MKIDYEFTVGVPVDRAWGRMLDLEKIAPCLPGAAIQEETGDGEYAGTIKVEIGPITVGYKGGKEPVSERAFRNSSVPPRNATGAGSECSPNPPRSLSALAESRSLKAESSSARGADGRRRGPSRGL